MAVLSLVILASPQAAGAEQQAKPGPEQHEHGAQQKPSAPTQERQVHDHSQMTAEQHGAASARDGSGTSWLPDASLMYAIHRQRGRWELMGHGNGFSQFLADGSRAGQCCASIAPNAYGAARNSEACADGSP